MTKVRALIFANRMVLAQAALGAAIWIWLAIREGYDFDWDVLNYHFYNGFAFLHAKTWSNVQPAMRQSYFAPIMDSGFYLLVRHLPATCVLIAIAAFQCLLYPMLFQLARLCLAPSVPANAARTVLAMLLAAIGMAAPVNIWEAGGALGDTTTAVPAVAGLLLMAWYLSQPDATGAGRLLACAGALAGLAAGLKLTNLPFAIAMLVALACQVPPPGRIAACLAGMAAAFALTYGWWAAMLIVHLGNPIFPSFNNVFRSPFASPTSFTDPAFLLPTWQDKLLFPFLRTSLSGRLDPAGLFDLRMALALPLCLLALVARARSLAAPLRALLVFVIVGYTAWLFAFPINRYLVTADMLAPLAATAALAALVRHRAAPWLASATLAVVLPLSASTAWPLFWLPGEHRHPDGAGYFAVRLMPPQGIDHAAVVMLGGYPTTFVIPYLPGDAVFVRAQGSLYYDTPAFAALSAQSPPNALRAVFGNATGQAACKILTDPKTPLFVLRPFPQDTPQDEAAMHYYGIAYDHAGCTPITSKANLQMALCRATGLHDPPCNADAR